MENKFKALGKEVKDNQKDNVNPIKAVENNQKDNVKLVDTSTRK